MREITNSSKPAHSVCKDSPAFVIFVLLITLQMYLISQPSSHTCFTSLFPFIFPKREVAEQYLLLWHNDNDWAASICSVNGTAQVSLFLLRFLFSDLRGKHA